MVAFASRPRADETQSEWYSSTNQHCLPKLNRPIQLKAQIRRKYARSRLSTLHRYSRFSDQLYKLWQILFTD